MGKLIDVDELRKYIGLSERCEDCERDKFGCKYDYIFTRMDICGWLDDAPEAVVRCKECLMHGVCRFEQGLGLDGFCSQAERRTDGSD